MPFAGSRTRESSSACFSIPIRRNWMPAQNLACDAIELHTGAYAQATQRHNVEQTQAALETLIKAGDRIRAAGITLNAGHGLTYRNVKPIAAIEGMHELNIGHSIIARAIMVGLEQAVRDMKRLIS